VLVLRECITYCCWNISNWKSLRGWIVRSSSFSLVQLWFSAVLLSTMFLRQACYTYNTARSRVPSQSEGVTGHVVLSREGAVVLQVGVLEESQRCNRIRNTNFLIVFHSIYGSILHSFRDMATERTTVYVQSDRCRQPTNTWHPKIS